MIFHQIATERGCQSYFVACPQGCVAAIIDPEDSLIERYKGLAAQEGVSIRYLLDTHTHADHFSATCEMGEELGVPVIMHRSAPAPFVTMRVDDGERINLGKLPLEIMHTPGHTADSMSVLVDGRVFTGDTLLLGGCGRTDLPSGDPAQLYDSLFNKLLLLDPATRVYPAHIYSDREYSTIGDEIADNPRLQFNTLEDFVAQMNTLTLKDPDHLSEALRTNLSGGRTVEQLIADAAHQVPFMSLMEVNRRVSSEEPGIVVLDVREREAWREAHIPGSMLIPRGQLELKVNELLPDPTCRIVVYCDYGKISTLATATLRTMGFTRAVALDGGLTHWQQQGYRTDAAPD
jgi:glyoxylase-like metal-dependent hydrolase (beta-lactamase superfamily II)/rhodanese-related sulfurtransferase